MEASLFKNQDEQEDTDKEHMIDRLPLPDIVQQALANSNDTQKDVLGISAFKAYIANYVTELIFNALSFVLVFLQYLCIMKIIIRCLNLLSRLPVIHTMNKMGGLLVGFIKRHDYSLDSLYYYYYIKRYGTGRLFVCAD